MQIKTRKLKPTDRLGERVRATGGGYTALVAWDYSLSTEEMHAYAARVCAQRISGASIPPEVKRVESTDTGYVFEVVA